MGPRQEVAQSDMIVECGRDVCSRSADRVYESNSSEG